MPSSIIAMGTISKMYHRIPLIFVSPTIFINEESSHIAESSQLSLKGINNHNKYEHSIPYSTRIEGREVLRKVWQRKKEWLAKTDALIDAVVYRLYGLTEEEICFTSEIAMKEEYACVKCYQYYFRRLYTWRMQ